MECVEVGGYCEGWEWGVWRWEDTVRVGSGVCGGGRIL